MISKHRQFDDDGRWIEGDVIIAKNSSLRKLMRAARRGKMPDERQVLIDAAMERAKQRTAAYLNNSPLKRAYCAKRDQARLTKGKS